MPDPMLFAAEDIPHMAQPVDETSMVWQQANLLRAAERIRFNPDRCAAYSAACWDDAPDCDPVGFLDFIIEQLGGRSQ